MGQRVRSQRVEVWPHSVSGARRSGATAVVFNFPHPSLFVWASREGGAGTNLTVMATAAAVGGSDTITIMHYYVALMAGSLTLDEMEGLLRRYPVYSSIQVFVETGTYYGATILAMKKRFPHCHSIELSPRLYVRALLKHGLKGIRFHFGDSSKVLRKLAKRIDQPAIFFLDAHWSHGDTARGEKDVPVLDELAILAERPHLDLIIIDDYRLFGTSYEDWSEVTTQKVLSAFPKTLKLFEIENDRVILGC